MRTEQEMLDLIINTAKEDHRIRAVYMEGSRTNPNVPRDIFQDYDIEYIVTETASFREDRTWIDRFGKRLYMQYPEENVYYDDDIESSYGWLIQFADGNRMDLHVCTREHALKNLEMYQKLLDKDGILPGDGDHCDERYWVKRPAQNQFSCTCNEFWWCLNNVAKGLWREELPYVMEMIDSCVRPMLRRLLEWKVGCEYDFQVSTGKAGKYLKNYLPEQIYSRYLATYTKADTQEIWNGVMEMCELFREIAGEVSERLGLIYDREEADNSLGYLKHVRELPGDAKEIY